MRSFLRKLFAAGSRSHKIAGMARSYKFYQHRLAFYLLLTLSITTFAAIEERQFASPVEEQRYQSLIEELRCPKCQNQNLADSDAEIAGDLRDEIYRQLREGRSDTEIVNYLVSRYGEFVNYRPPLDNNTLLLWSAPGILVFIGLLIWLRRFAVKKSPSSVVLSEIDQQRLNDLLQSSQATSHKKESGEPL
jgi:cytochrome c-type biogenesis protein CcmH